MLVVQKQNERLQLREQHTGHYVPPCRTEVTTRRDRVQLIHITSHAREPDVNCALAQEQSIAEGYPTGGIALTALPYQFDGFNAGL